MIHFVDNNGTIIKTIESPVYQGSAESNNIILIAPFAANLQFTVAFFLPNGEITPRYAMTQGGTLNGVEYAPTNGAMAIWTFSMPNNITQYFGTVYAQFYAYGTNGQITASSRTSFVVARGVPEELPDSPDPTIYNQILTALSQINTALNNGSYAARAIYWWINTYTYGMNEITFYPIGTYGAFVRSTVTGNTGNQPYNDDGVLDSAHWQELVNFNKIYAAEQNAITQAQAAAESAQNAEASASAAAQSAQDAADSANSIGQSEQNAAQSAQAAAESAQAAAESASKAEGVLQNAAIKNEAETIRAPWDFDTQNGPIDFYFENKDSSCVTINGFSVAISYNNGDYIKTTQYQDDRIVYQANETQTYTLEFPEKNGTLALTSDVAAEASERESADNALQSDIDGIQQQLSETQHFRGYYETTAQVQSISNPHSGDYAWNAQTGTVWNYSTSWSDSGVAIPDQTVPKSKTTPLMDGTATLGSTNTYADGAHRHPTDTTRASVTALNSETESRTAADNNLQSQLDDIKDGTTVVGRATNVTSQIDGHAISDIFETDGTTVKEATQAQRASADEDGNNIPNTYARQNGNYPTLVAGTANRLTAVLLTASDDLNSIVGTDYYGKIFNWGANSVPANAPSSAAGNMIVLPHGTNTSVQYVTLDTAESGTTRPTTYQREARSGYTSDWEEIVTSDGSYKTLGAGRVVAAGRLEAGSDVNNCIPEEYEALYVWSCWSIAAVPGILNLPAGLTGTFYLTAYKTWAGDTADKYRLIQTIYECAGNRGIYQRSEDNSGGDGNIASPWQQLVYADGSYPTLGAGYLAKNLQFGVGTAGGAWYKVAEVDVSSVWANNPNRSYSAFILLNTAHRTQASGTSLGSGLIEFDIRKMTENGVAQINATETGTILLAGNIQADRIATSISGFTVSLYIYLAYNYEALDITVVTESDEGVRCNYITLAQSNAGTSAPSGAVYAVNRNVAANTKRHVIKLRNNAAAANYIVFFTFTDNSDTKYTSVSALANALYNLGYNSEDNAYPVSGEFLSNGSALTLSRNYVVRSGSQGVSDGTHTYYSGTRQFNMVEENASNSPNEVGYVGISEGTITNVEATAGPTTGNYFANVTNDGKGISVTVSRVTSPNTNYTVKCTITYTLPILGNNVFAIYGTNNGFLHVLVQSDIENVLYEDISISPSIITDI